MSKSNLSKKVNGKDNNISRKKNIKIGRDQAGKFIDVDRRISTMAKRGELAYSGENAFNRSLKRGLPVIIAEDGAIYKVYPNVTKALLKKQKVIYRDSKTGRFYKK
jgi:hypothetical protein